MKPLQFSSQILKVESKVDRTLNVRLNTQELHQEEAGILYNLSGKQIWTAFAELPLGEKDLIIPEFVKEFPAEKPYSERVSHILFRLWEQQPDKKGKTARQFYEDYMEKLISHLKEKLN